MNPPYPGLVSARCRSCRYFWHINESSGYMGCEYILHTGVCRPCPPGDACTVYRKKPVNIRHPMKAMSGPYRWTPSRIRRAELFLAEGLTYREVAERMGTTKSAVRNAVTRARKEKESNGTTDLL